MYCYKNVLCIRTVLSGQHNSVDDMKYIHPQRSSLPCKWKYGVSVQPNGHDMGN